MTAVRYVVALVAFVLVTALVEVLLATALSPLGVGTSELWLLAPLAAVAGAWTSLRILRTR